MERVTFVVESTGERLGCLLNPESLQVTRNAGVRRRRTATGLLAGAGISDDPLLYAGGGQTDLVLDLLFDIGIAGSTIQTGDVRDLTRPLWDLAESTAASAGATPPVVRFLWGKAWNVPGVVTAVAERLEDFDTGGVPARSWLRMRLARVPEDAAAPDEGGVLAPSQVPVAALGALSHVRVHRRLAAPALCELTFHDGPDLDLATLPALGAQLRVALAAD